MKIFYLSATCSKTVYEIITRDDVATISIPAYKFNYLLADGLNKQKDVDVTCIIPNTIHGKLAAITPDYDMVQKENGIEFVFLSYCKGPFKVLLYLKNIYAYINQYCNDNRDVMIVFDALNITAALSSIMIGKLKGVRAIGIITDFPQHIGPQERTLKLKITDYLHNRMLRSLQGYVFLTEQMNKVINHAKRPYCVIEGFCDKNMENTENNLADKYEKKVCMYTGSLHKKFGIENLIYAFSNLKLPDVELHIYGVGDYVDEIRKICRKHDNIKYCGLKPNNIVVKEQIKATLLINPRTTSEELTKYSFPSKNIEYMVSGTPVLTTKLPGMPEDYYDYVYLFTDETVDGMTAKLKEVVSKSSQELHQFGMNSKRWVLKEKNNVVQAKKILEMCVKNS